MSHERSEPENQCNPLKLKPFSESVVSHPLAPLPPASRDSSESGPFLGLQMHRGYIKLWRKLEDSAVFRDAHAYHLFSWLLIQAQYHSDKYSTSFKDGNLYLKKGECIFGRNIVADALQTPPSTIRNALDRLEEKYRIITTKKDNKRTIVTILNWDTYQQPDIKTGQPEDNGRTTKGQQKDTNQEGKKERKEEGKKELGASRPTIEQVKAYFLEQNHPLEAEKFFDHFQSNGWKVGGKTPMKDWQAAARNWVRRQKEKESPSPETAEDKKYKALMARLTSK